MERTLFLTTGLVSSKKVSVGMSHHVGNFFWISIIFVHYIRSLLVQKIETLHFALSSQSNSFSPSVMFLQQKLNQWRYTWGEDIVQNSIFTGTKFFMIWKIKKMFLVMVDRYNVNKTVLQLMTWPVTSSFQTNFSKLWQNVHWKCHRFFSFNQSPVVSKVQNKLKICCFEVSLLFCI